LSYDAPAQLSSGRLAATLASMRSSITFLLFITLASVGCQSTTVVPLNPDDGTHLISFDGDTLRFYTSADFIYEPFGPIPTPSDIRRSMPPWLAIDSIQRDEHYFYSLTSSQAQFMLFVDQDSEATRSSYVQAGSLTTPMLTISSGFRIGDRIERFLKRQFATYPSSWNRSKVIEYASALAGDYQTYVFQADTLASVTFCCRDCIATFKF
jgi:hypothetical protein